MSSDCAVLVIEIEKDILIKTEVGETYEFRIKTELENLHLVEETGKMTIL